MKKEKVILLILFLEFALSIFCLFPVKSFASTMDFTVEAKLPENQIDQSLSYFDLLVTPGKEELLQLVITNHSDRTIRVMIEATTAVTSESGTIDYSQIKPTMDLALKHPFSSLIKDKSIEPIVLKANEKKDISIALQIPKETFEGSILGGLKFSQEMDENSDKSGTIQIENQYFYILGVRLRENKDDPDPIIKLNSVTVGNRYGQPVFLANLKNTVPTIVKSMTVEYSISKSESSKVILSDKQEGLNMAPLSNFDYAIKLQNKRFKKGDYQLSMTIKSGNNKWAYKKKFNVTESQVHEINTSQEHKANVNLVFILIFLLIVFILIIIFLKIKFK